MFDTNPFGLVHGLVAEQEPFGEPALVLETGIVLRVDLGEHGVTIIGAVEVGELERQFEVEPVFALALRVEPRGIVLISLVGRLGPFETLAEGLVVAVLTHTEGVDIGVAREGLGPLRERRVGGLVNEDRYLSRHQAVRQVQGRGKAGAHIVDTNGYGQHLCGILAPLFEHFAHFGHICPRRDELPFDIEEVVVGLGNKVIFHFQFSISHLPLIGFPMNLFAPCEAEEGGIMAAEEIAVHAHVLINDGNPCTQALCDKIGVMGYMGSGESHLVGHLRGAEQDEVHILFVVGSRMFVSVERREAFAVDEHALCPALRCVHHRQVELCRQRFGL